LTHEPSTELIRDALAHIPATLDRDEWARVAMAIKSAFPDSSGFDLFDTWSQRAQDQYDPKASRATWRSVKAGGGVGIATLLHIAKQHGFTPSKDGVPASPPTSEELVTRARERTERLQQEQSRIDAGHAAAADQAAAQWQEASESGTSAYLVRKGVLPYGVRFAADGWLLVPLRDGAGKLWNLQRIAPAKPGSGSDKFFLKGGRKSGLWHLVGELASGDTDTGPAVLLTAEGLATASTLHQATGYPVAVAFDAGNLQHVARALRQQYPAALLVVCGDDDRDTEQKSGTNPGRVKAMAAAKAVRGLAVFPEGLPDGGSDFNDQAAHVTAEQGVGAGLEAVRRTVVAAIDEHTAAQASAQEAKGTKPRGQAGQRQSSGASGPPSMPPGAPPGDPDEPGDKAAPDWDRFTVTDAGVFHQGVDRNGEPTKPDWVCSRLDVVALTNDQDGNGWGYLLNFADPLGRHKQWAMPSRMLAGDGAEYRGALMGMGLRIATNPRARNLLTQYIQTRQPGEFATCTDRIGWHGRVFVLPHETVGDEAQQVVFQSESAQENTFRVKGSPEQWRERVGMPCAGNSRLVFAVSAAFAGPTLKPAGMEGGGFHMRGDGSTGKSTTQVVAASVYGNPERFKQSWKATDNALEGVAAQHNDCLLILDEIGEVDPKVVGECAYMLGNGQGKARAARTGVPRPRLAWRLLFLSSGEKSLSDHMQEVGKRTKAGQETRMADIPADAGKGMGAFENVHDHEGGAAFSRHLVAQASACHGAAGRAWLHWLTDNAEGLRERIRTLAQRIELQIVPEAGSGQVQRVGARFALVGAAGELATAAGLTGWDVGEAESAARECFNAWLVARGGIGNSEETSMLRQLRHFLEANGDGRFVTWHRAHDDHAPRVGLRAGVRRLIGSNGLPIGIRKTPEFAHEISNPEGESVEFFILPEVFKSEICKGYDPEAMARALRDRGCLETKEPGRFTVSMYLPGGIGKARCYHVNASIFDLEP
jgi:putative DNA primase/helicase